jgi:hypothetical protein
VQQIDLGARTIRLEPGETKNDEGRTVVMTGLVYALLQQCVAGKSPTTMYSPVQAESQSAISAGPGRRSAQRPKTPGLLFHGLRRTAVRNMVRRGFLNAWRWRSQDTKRAPFLIATTS